MKRATLLVLLAAAFGTAQARLVDIEWDTARRFETTAAIAPGKMLEVCGRIDKRQQVAWSFESDAALDFNIHYHEGTRVVFAARRDATSAAGDTLVAPLRQDYCWMWTNRGVAPVSVTLILQQRQ